MRRLAAFALAGALVSLVVAGCAKRTPQPTVVEFWQPFEAARYDTLVARFERENPGVRVDVRTIPAAAMRDSIVAALASGAVPDLAVLDSTVMPTLLAKGALSDWSAGVADLRDSLVGWELCSVGDALYGMPWLLETRVLYVNRDAFARARLDPATATANWRALAPAAQRLRAAGAPLAWAIDDPAGAPLACLVAEGRLLAPGSGDSLAVDSESARGAIVLLEQIRAAARTAELDELAREAPAGRLGAIVAGPALATAVGARFVALPLPSPDTSRATRSGVTSGLALASFSRASHKEPALRFARSLASPAAATECAAAFPAFAPAAARTGAFATQALRDWTPPACAHGAERVRVLTELLAAAGRRELPDTAWSVAQRSLDRLREERP